jgi:hypothetical protein
MLSDAAEPGPPRIDVPLCVLTGRATASAAGECAFVPRRLTRATLVDDRTVGAGHTKAIAPIGHGCTRISHGVSYGTARSDLLKLVGRGLLEQRKVGKAHVFVPEAKLTELLSSGRDLPRSR